MALLVRPNDPSRDGQHDFDFEIGSWTTGLSRLVINWIATDTTSSADDEDRCLSVRYSTIFRRPLARGMARGAECRNIGQESA